MLKTKTNSRKPLQERLAELEKSGETGPAIYRRLEREGYVVSLASVTRALRVIRGPQRVGRRVPARPAQVERSRPRAAVVSSLTIDGSSPAPSAAAPAAPPTAEDLRRDLAGQIRTVESELAGAESAALRASLNRVLVSARQLLVRATPPDPNVAPPGMKLVSTADWPAKANVGEARLAQLIRGTMKDRESWPRCHTCGQSIPPDDLESRIQKLAEAPHADR